MLFTVSKCDEVLSSPVDELYCDKCDAEGLSVHGEVCYLAVEFFEVPLMVYRRRFSAKCHCCGHIQQVSHSRTVESIKRKMFSLSYYLGKHIGLMLVAFLSVFLWQDHQRQKAQTHALLDKPEANDFYFIDYHRFNPDSHPKYRYTTMKVASVKGGEIALKLSTISHSRKAKASVQLKSDRAMMPNFFYSDDLVLRKRQLRKLYEEGIIYEVRRPRHLKIDGWLVMRPIREESYTYRYNLDNQKGISLYRGENGYAQDYHAAFEAFLLAAEAGDASGQNNLAEMYRDGIGTEADIDKALYWFAQAAILGHNKARENYQQLCKWQLNCPPISAVLSEKSGN